MGDKELRNQNLSGLIVPPFSSDLITDIQILIPTRQYKRKLCTDLANGDSPDDYWGDNSYHRCQNLFSPLCGLWKETAMTGVHYWNIHWSVCANDSIMERSPQSQYRAQANISRNHLLNEYRRGKLRCNSSGEIQTEKKITYLLESQHEFTLENISELMPVDPHEVPFLSDNDRMVMFCDDDCLFGIADIIRLARALRFSESPDQLGWQWHSEKKVAYAYVGRWKRVNTFHFGDQQPLIFKTPDFDVEELTRDNYIPMPTMILEKYLAAYPFDEHLERFQDWDLWLAMEMRNLFGVRVPEASFIQYTTRSSISETKDAKVARDYIEKKHRIGKYA